MNRFEEFPQEPSVPDAELQQPMSAQLALHIVKAGTLLAETVRMATKNEAQQDDSVWRVLLPGDHDPFDEIPFGYRRSAPTVANLALHGEIQYMAEESHPFFGSLEDFTSTFYPEGSPLGQLTFLYPVEAVAHPTFEYHLTSKQYAFDPITNIGRAHSKTMAIPMTEAPTKVRETKEMEPGEWVNATAEDGMNVFQDLAQLHRNLEEYLADGGEVRF